MEDLLQVGVISSTHGVRGEAKIYPTTDDKARFKKLSKILLDTGEGKKELAIEGVKFFKQFAILKFKGIDRLEDIKPYKGKGLFVSRQDAVPLGEDEYFIADLMGMEVYSEEGNMLGHISDVIETGANDVYEITHGDGSGTFLLPAIKQCVLSVDIEKGRMEVRLLDGLLN